MSSDKPIDAGVWAHDERMGTPMDMVVEAVSRALKQGCGEIAVCELLPGVSLLVLVGNSDTVQATAATLSLDSGCSERGH